jgi:hypothetical protein
MVDYAIEPAAGRLTLSSLPPTLRVTRREELPAALAQREKPVVIADSDIETLFEIIERGRSIRLLGVGIIIASVVCYGITLKYKIEWNWQYHWDIQRLDGKITLTPTSGDHSKGQ